MILRLKQGKYLTTVMRELIVGVRRTCNICGFTGSFLPMGSPPRYGARCAQCGSLERQRLLVLCDSEKGLFAGKRVLHFAPEEAISEYVKSTGPARYDGADIAPGPGQLELNLEKVDLEDGSYDVVLASHVLEHVDDSLALPEIARVLAPGGVAVLMVPIVEGWPTTYENTEVTTPEDREAHFGRFNHMRYYGRDFRDRIEAAGFVIEEFVAVEPHVHVHGLERGETVFVCRRG